VPTERERQDTQELDELRQSDERAAGDGGSEQRDRFPGAPPGAPRPLPPDRGERHRGEQAGEESEERIAAENEERPEDRNSGGQ
jgi:hypothetical protein